MDDRVARCHLLAAVLAADGIMTDDERALLEQRIANHELSDQLIEAALADGKLSPNETATVKKIVHALGLE